VLYRFGLFEFDPAAGELRKQGRLVRIEPQPARALGLLLAHPGTVITREQLRAHVWDAGTHVDFDRGLAYCLGQVRTALGDAADNPRFVETLPRRGYRFIAPVQVEGGPEVTNPASGDAAPTPAGKAAAAADAARAAGPPGPGASAGPVLRVARWAAVVLGVLAAGALAWTAWARLTPDRPLVAVAIFDNETGDAAYDRLASTAADIMVERLTALGSDRIGVIGNTPALRVAREERSPAAIRDETGAGFFVAGQVQHDDAGVRLVVHLIRLDDDTHLWVTRVARGPADLADIQDVVADRLAEAVRRHVIEADPDAPRFTR
jgi:DNA-binding winged helix-turn-helix (wHTH) protein/TolB-like protein